VTGRVTLEFDDDVLRVLIDRAGRWLAPVFAEHGDPADCTLGANIDDRNGAVRFLLVWPDGVREVAVPLTDLGARLRVTIEVDAQLDA